MLSNLSRESSFITIRIPFVSQKPILLNILSLVFLWCFLTFAKIGSYKNVSYKKTHKLLRFWIRSGG